MNPLRYVSEAIDRQKIKGLKRQQISKISKIVTNALIRSDAWTQDPSLSRDIIDNGIKFVNAENLLRKAEAIGIDTSKLISKLK